MDTMIRLVATAICFSGVVFSASAQDWPKRRNIEIILPSAAGSGPDATMRSYSERLSQNLGQVVFITNRAGGSGTIAASAAMRAEPDGYTFFLASSSQLIVNKYTIKNLNYDPDIDFKPVSLLNSAPYIVLTNSDTPFRNLDQLVNYARANPQKVFAAYEGATAKAATLYLLNALGLTLTLVPYVNPNQAMQDLMAGNVQLHLQGTALGLPFVKDGRLPALAVTGAARFPSLPDVPTVSETYPAFDGFGSWVMLLAPARTPDEIVLRMSQEIGKIAKLPEIQQLFDNLGIIASDDTSPAAAVAFLRAQNEQFARMARIADLKAE